MSYEDQITGSGWLHRLDPRTKLLLISCGAMLLVALEQWPALLALLVLIHIGLLTSRVPLRQIGWVWRQLRRVLLVVVLAYPLLARVPGPVLWSWGPVSITTAAVMAGLMTATRVIGMSLLFFLLLFTTRQNELVRGLVRLGLPFEWGLTLAIALRYIPTFGRAVEQMQEAQAARGWQPGGSLRTRVQGVIPVVIALVIEVVRTADTLGMALAARGVGSGRPRSVWRDIRLQPVDWAVMVVALLLTAGALAWAR